MVHNWFWFNPGWSNKELLGAFSVPTLNRGLYAYLLWTIKFRELGRLQKVVDIGNDS